jgi:hypothetical protein
LGLESGVVVDGFDKSGEDAIGRGGVLEKSKFGSVDLIVGKVGGEVGWVHKPSFELGLSLKRSAGPMDSRRMAVNSATAT